MGNLRKRLAVVFLSILTMLSLIGSTYASSNEASSASQTKTVYGHTYTFFSNISSAYERFGQLAAGTRLSCSTRPSLPKGYMGTQVRMYNASGVLFSSGAWKYTTYDTSVTGYQQVFDVKKDTYYYSQGMVALYNGNGYTKFICTKTPNYILKSKSTSLSDVVVRYNEKGEIFGAAPILEQINVSPDLILAIGTDGQEGYVKADDLNQSYITTPEQAVTYMSSVDNLITESTQQSYITIPLYESNGTTVIGDFALYLSDELTTETYDIQ